MEVSLKMVLQYIKDKKKVILMFIIFEIIFCSICGLYQFDKLTKLFYGVYISAFIGLCYGIWDYFSYAERARKINEAYINIENIAELLPQPVCFMEAGYQEIIKYQFGEMQQMAFEAGLKETDTKDYYTLWAHQIKTPIAAMRLLLQNQENSTGSYAMMEELFKIEQYVEMVLHYLRLDSISSDMMIKEYDLKDIVNQAVKKHALLFINNKLSINIPDFSYTIITDEKWLQFVIEQLVSNALKYTVHGGISIYIEIISGNTLLVIEDSGIGIREEDLPRIFEKGFTGYNGRLDKKSTGIGLYLCKQILDKLSYKIYVDSQLGRGTKVSIDVSNNKFL